MKAVKFTATDLGFDFPQALPVLTTFNASRGAQRSPVLPAPAATEPKKDKEGDWSVNATFAIYANEAAFTDGKNPITSVNKQYKLSDTEIGNAVSIIEKLATADFK